MAERKKPISYNKELLDEYVKRDGATLIDDYDKLNRDTIIQYICICGKESKRNFRSIYIHEILCKECICKIRIKKAKATNLERYGVEYISQNKDIRNKVINTNLERYGVKNVFQNKDIRNKASLTNLERYGVENPFQNEEVKAKIVSTFVERYGVTHPLHLDEYKEKRKETNLERYGVEHTYQNDDVKAKGVATNLERYGVENPIQNSDIFNKAQNSSFNRKEVIMPSGIIRKVQGYEHFALKELIQIYTEDQIKTGCTNVPRIQYDIDGKKHYYFPDIFIPHENKLIEVKSKWTYLLNSGIVQAKKNACVDQGFIYEFWCYDRKGNRIEV